MKYVVQSICESLTGSQEKKFVYVLVFEKKSLGILMKYFQHGEIHINYRSLLQCACTRMLYASTYSLLTGAHKIFRIQHSQLE